MEFLCSPLLVKCILKTGLYTNSIQFNIVSFCLDFTKAVAGAGTGGTIGSAFGPKGAVVGAIAGGAICLMFCETDSGWYNLKTFGDFHGLQ